MIEGGADDIAAHHILSPSVLPRHSISLHFNETPLDRSNMSLNQSAVAAYQRLDAHRFRRAEDAVPARTMLAIVSRGGDKYQPAVRMNALEQGAEIAAADVAGEPEERGPFANPAADTGLALSIV